MTPAHKGILLEMLITYHDRYYYGPPTPRVVRMSMRENKYSFGHEYKFGRSTIEKRVPSGAGYRMW